MVIQDGLEVGREGVEGHMGGPVVFAFRSTAEVCSRYVSTESTFGYGTEEDPSDRVVPFGVHAFHGRVSAPPRYMTYSIVFRAEWAGGVGA